MARYTSLSSTGNSLKRVTRSQKLKNATNSNERRPNVGNAVARIAPVTQELSNNCCLNIIHMPVDVIRCVLSNAPISSLINFSMTSGDMTKSLKWFDLPIIKMDVFDNEIRTTSDSNGTTVITNDFNGTLEDSQEVTVINGSRFVIENDNFFHHTVATFITDNHLTATSSLLRYIKKVFGKSKVQISLKSISHECFDTLWTSGLLELCDEITVNTNSYKFSYDYEDDFDKLRSIVSSRQKLVIDH